jgi:hypothetical protein
MSKAHYCRTQLITPDEPCADLILESTSPGTQPAQGRDMSTGRTRRSLVYAYGCGTVESGLDHAMSEAKRCNDMWEDLVAIDRAWDQQMRSAAALDVPAMSVRAEAIAVLTARLADAPDHKDARAQRRMLYREQRADMMDWIKTHRQTVDEIDRRRLVAVTACRRRWAPTTWWPNYNRVLESYITGRRVAARKGRLIRSRDPRRNDTVLAAQIKPKRSGLENLSGATPDELHNGTIRSIQIGRVAPIAYDPTMGRCERGRLCRTMLEMRVDRAGHTIRVPVWMHRPLPHGCRVKVAQLVARPRGTRLAWKLCLTVDLPSPLVPATAGPATRLTLAWDHADDGSLIVLRAQDRSWSLPERWWRGMLRLRALEEYLRECSEESKDYRRCVEQIREGRQNLLHQRRDHYRRIAREVVRAYECVEIDDRDLSRIARDERGTQTNSLRHAAGTHYLRAEIIHQASKIGRPVLARGRVMNASRDRKPAAWTRRKRQKPECSHDET